MPDAVAQAMPVTRLRVFVPSRIIDLEYFAARGALLAWCWMWRGLPFPSLPPRKTASGRPETSLHASGRLRAWHAAPFAVRSWRCRGRCGHCDAALPWKSTGGPLCLKADCEIVTHGSDHRAFQWNAPGRVREHRIEDLVGQHAPDIGVAIVAPLGLMSRQEYAVDRKRLRDDGAGIVQIEHCRRSDVV